jgi:flagellar basal body P-ring formation protein FlgA
MAHMKKLLYTGWIFLGLLLLAGGPTEGASRPSITIHFQKEVVVQQDYVYLRDIATIQGSPHSFIARIGQMKMKKAPWPGESLVLSSEDVYAYIHSQSLSSLDVDWEVPDQIVIRREGRVVEEEEVAQILETHLQEMIRDDKKTASVKDIRGYEKVIIPPGLFECEVNLPEQGKRGGSIGATLIFRVDGKEIKKFRISARVEIYADVVVSKSYLPRYQVIGEKDVERVKKNIALLPQDVVTDLEEVLGKRTTLSVNGQEVIRRGMTEIPPLVKKGDRVILLVENDQFKISAPGEVKEDGRKGDRVKLVNLSSKKEVYGRVADANTVLVDF